MKQLTKELKFLTPHRLKEALPTLDLKFFRDAGACYDPSGVSDETWTGTILDVLAADHIPADDRIWAATRKGAMPDNLQRLCAVAAILNTKTSKGSVYNLMDDDRSKAAVLAAEQFANGVIGDAALAAARDTARAAAWDAVWDAAWDAARNAARDAARATARATARDTARNAARDAVRAAVWDAARNAAWDAAWDAARNAARDAMPTIFAETIKINIKC